MMVGLLNPVACLMDASVTPPRRISTARLRRALRSSTGGRDAVEEGKKLKQLNFYHEL
jgi:hypothetical protein